MNGALPKEPVDTAELFRAHAHFVARFLTRLGVAPGELDDAVQEVFLVVHRNGGYVPGPATPTGYLASIAVRAASSYRRRGRKTRDRRSETAPDEVSSAGLDPARSLEVQQSLAELQVALDGLEPSLRATLVLAELEGESCDSIATAMQIAVGTVYWRLHRARKTFRAAIESRRVAEGRAGGLAVGALLFSRPAEEVLQTARAHPGVGFDEASALARFREALGGGVSTAPWAAATRAAVASGVGLKAPAILSALVVVHAIGAGISRWDAGRTAASRPAPAALLASIAPEIPGESPMVDAPPAPAAPMTVVAADVLRPASDAVQVEKRAAPAAIRVERPTPAASVDMPTTANRPAPVAAGEPPSVGDPPSPDDATREIQEVASARQILARDPARALSLARSGEARFASGYLGEERRYIGVVALFKLGRLDEGRAEAARFLTDYPDGPFSARVRAIR
jgi:RNA polymerase sigma-70 factor, ECF subfamily